MAALALDEVGTGEDEGIEGSSTGYSCKNARSAFAHLCFAPLQLLLALASLTEPIPDPLREGPGSFQYLQSFE